MANSSMLVLPRMIAPACFSRCVIVASYGGCQPSRMREPQVVGMPSVVKTSLTATGTPASGPSCSPAARLFVDRRRLGERAVRRDVQEGVHAVVHGGDPVQVRLGDLGRGDLVLRPGRPTARPRSSG